MALIDLTGQNFGRLTVLYRDIESEKNYKDRHARWRCKCNCGNETTVVGKDLRAGKTLSCGCFMREHNSQTKIIDLTNKRFGKLTVLNYAYSKNHRSYWNCLCDCGNNIIVCARELSKGDTSSCGCIHSKGENKIEILLKTLKIPYKKEFYFKNLYIDNNYGNFLRFDFALFNNQQELIGLIEYDGVQHFKVSGWNTLSRLKQTQKYDKLKTNYCQNHNIPLIRIPYTDYNKLDIQYLKERIENKCQKLVDL